MSVRNDIKNIQGSEKDLKNFGLLVGGIFFGLGLLFFYFGKSSWMGMSEVGIVLLIFGLIYPKILYPLYKAWMIFGTVMGFVITTIILTIFFYLIFTPLALILRVSGKHFLNLNFRTGEKSYWNRRLKETAKISLEKQF